LGGFGLAELDVVFELGDDRLVEPMSRVVWMPTELRRNAPRWGPVELVQALADDIERGMVGESEAPVRLDAARTKVLLSILRSRFQDDWPLSRFLRTARAFGGADAGNVLLA
jgi:hypothetical protein